jgi:hypothetical protein
MTRRCSLAVAAGAGVGLALALVLGWQRLVGPQGDGGSMPARATWLGAPAGYADGKPPSLGEAWHKAAEYAGLPADEVYFVRVAHFDWGDSYEFVYAPHVWSTCGVQVPGLRVWKAPLRQPWKPQSAPADLPLSVTSAKELAETFIRESLDIPLDALEYTSGVPTSPDPAYMTLDWNRVADSVVLPGFVKVHVDPDRGAVVAFANLDVPLAAPLTPTLSKEAAIERARRHWQAYADSESAMGDIEVAPVSYQRLQIRYWQASESAQFARQRLTWVVCLDGPLPTGEPNTEFARPEQYATCLDAVSGALLSAERRPAVPATRPSVLPDIPAIRPDVGPHATWGAVATVDATAQVAALLKQEWRPPAGAAVIRRSEASTEATYVSYNVAGVDVTLGVWPRETPSAFLNVRLVSSRTASRLSWDAQDEPLSLLARVRSLVLALNEPEIPKPRRQPDALERDDGTPPYAVPPPPETKLRFRKSSVLRSVRGDQTAAQYELTANGWEVHAWVLPTDPAELHMMALR